MPSVPKTVATPTPIDAAIPPDSADRPDERELSAAANSPSSPGTSNSAADNMPTGRLRRLSRLAGLATSVSAQVAGAAARRVMGGDGSGAANKSTPVDPARAAIKISDGVLDDDAARNKEKLEAWMRDAGLSLESAHRIVDTLGQMKGVAMKFGQQLSMEQDMFPEEVRQVIQKLCNDVEPMSWDTVRAVLEAELQGGIDEHFASIDQTAFAAASLGQVHRGTLKDGTAVAIKIQYPGVDTALVNDLKNIGLLIKTVTAVSGRGGEAKGFFNEIAGETENELDYVRERRNNRALRKALEPWPDLIVPRVFQKQSTSKVLTMEFLSGTTLKDWVTQDPGPSEAERFRVASQLVRAIYGPFLSQGLVHADPHPGNFMVLPDGRLAVLDAGIVKQLPVQFVGAYWALAAGDLKAKGSVDIIESLKQSGFVFKLPDERARDLIDRMSAIVRRPMETDVFDFGELQLVRDMRALGMAYGMEMMKIMPPPEALFFFRAVGGLTMNLGLMKAKGDFRPLIHDMVFGDYLQHSDFSRTYAASQGAKPTE
jgi:predicted unusual protein kinase regulating ubiquinone biosynthesis (AarF/ABC1/UbiB family)